MGGEVVPFIPLSSALAKFAVGQCSLLRFMLMSELLLVPFACGKLRQYTTHNPASKWKRYSNSVQT